MKPVPLKTSVNRALSQVRHRGSDIRLGSRLGRVWAEIVGELFVRFCFPIDVHGQILTIGVTSPVWMAEMDYHRDTVLANIERELGKKEIKQIRLKMLSRAPQNIVRQPTIIPPPLDPVVLTAEQEAHLEQALAHVKDPILRERTKRVLMRALSHPIGT